MRWLGLALLVYAPHLLQEHFEGMHDDPLIVAAFDFSLGELSARGASYLVFQVMMFATLAVTWLFARGGWTQRAVLAGIAVGLLGETHHLLRGSITLESNPGLLTSLPMPILGAFLVRFLWRSAPPSPSLTSNARIPS